MFDRPQGPSPRNGLRAALLDALSDSPRRNSVELLVHDMVRIAVAYLRLRDRRHAFRHHVSPLTERDLALECIADLFRRDGQGRFPELRRRFDPVLTASMDPATLFSEVRRTVTRKVDDGLFRQLQESDPSLARLIRGLKRAAAACPETRVVKLRGLLWIEIGPESGHRQPEVPFEIFEALLGGAGPALRASDLLQRVVDTLRSLPGYEPRVPIVTAALCLRASIVRGTVPLEEVPYEEPDPVDPARLAASAARRPDGEPDGRNPDLETAYRAGAADVVAASFTSDGGGTHFEALSRYLPGLTVNEYRSRHRTRFEYLVRLTRTRFVQMARTELTAPFRKPRTGPVTGRPRTLN